MTFSVYKLLHDSHANVKFIAYYNRKKNKEFFIIILFPQQSYKMHVHAMLDKNNAIKLQPVLLHTRADLLILMRGYM